jgi:hypothetical protein
MYYLLSRLAVVVVEPLELFVFAFFLFPPKGITNSELGFTGEPNVPEVVPEPEVPILRLTAAWGLSMLRSIRAESGFGSLKGFNVTSLFLLFFEVSWLKLQLILNENSTIMNKNFLYMIYGLY